MMKVQVVGQQRDLERTWREKIREYADSLGTNRKITRTRRAANILYFSLQ